MVLLIIVEKRLQKIISEMGIASRRKAEELILQNRVTVNGKPATLGMKADPEKDFIKIDGKLLTKPEPKVYYIFNKPKNVVTTLYDPEGRPSLIDYLKKIKYKVFPVGRLDFDSEGLLILTNDGELANRIMHPAKKIPKTYLVKVKGIPFEEDLNKLRKGITLKDSTTAPANIKIIRKTDNNAWLEVTLYEGKKRQIRYMFEKIKHPVLKLKRIKIDGIQLKDLKPGELRIMTEEELKRLKSSAGL
jgi:pseudouridine synthase